MQVPETPPLPSPSQNRVKSILYYWRYHPILKVSWHLFIIKIILLFFQVFLDADYGMIQMTKMIFIQIRVVCRGGYGGSAPLDQWNICISGGFQAPTGAEPPHTVNKKYRYELQYSILFHLHHQNFSSKYVDIGAKISVLNWNIEFNNVEITIIKIVKNLTSFSWNLPIVLQKLVFKS